MQRSFTAFFLIDVYTCAFYFSTTVPYFTQAFFHDTLTRFKVVAETRDSVAVVVILVF